ncbi:MAG TPA: hypothetical protein VEA44_19195, partial [Caulobacter sp.]|nr:hypothetical protein [Caulobacter sp.]
MRAWPLLLLAPLAVASVAWSQPGKAPAATACRFEAWSSEPDPAGLNVRAGPSATARTVGKLPPPWYDVHTERTVRARFTVV